MEQVRSKSIDLEAVQRLLMAEVKNQSAQLLTGALRLELHFLRGQVVKVQTTQQKYLEYRHIPHGWIQGVYASIG